MTVEEIPIRKIEEFCKRWKITEFAMFGSVLREDFSADSDVDVLVTLGPESHVSLLDWVDMQDELRAVFGREVDLVSRGGLRNPFRRKEILRMRKVIYAESA